MQDNTIMRPRFKWFVALLLVCAMMAAFIPSFAGLNFTPDPAAPDLKIVSTLTDGGKFLEVGLNVDSKDGKFQSAGVLLSYNPAMLTPVIWGEVTQEDGTEVDGAVLDPGQATSAESAWSDAIVLPTKGADELSGKLAKAVELNGTGYLYISAEAAEAIPLAQKLPGTEEDTDPELPQPTPGTETQDESGDTETPTTPDRQTATASGMGISYIDEATAPTEQATIVRFKVNETQAAEGAEASLYTLEDLAGSLDVVVYDKATDNQTAKALLDNSLLALDPTDEKYAGVTYIADNSDYNTAGFDANANLEFVWIANGVSVNTGTGGGGSTGPADPSDFAAVVFYDWDETLLGTVIVPKGDATQQVTEFTNARIADSSELDDKYKWYSNDKIAADEADSTKTPKYLSNKKAYDFDTWLLNDSETFTAQDTALPKYDGTNDDAAAAAGVANFTNVTGDMIVKASYVANDTINKTNASGTDSTYTLSEPIYNRYGAAAAASGTYSLQITIMRENVDGYGVTRLREPGFRVNTTADIAGAAVVNALNSMENKDITSVEIAVPKKVRLASYTVIETYETPNWPGASQKSSVVNKYKNSGTTDNDLIGTDGFIKEGTLAFINEQCLIYLEQGSNTAWTVQANQFTFQDAGLTEPVGSTTTGAIARTNRGLIEQAIKDNNYQPLTYEQMRAALSLP